MDFNKFLRLKCICFLVQSWWSAQ